MTLYKWSQTAASDATVDSTINWAEGQAPSSINDSARAMMAATAKYRDDIAGAIVTGGTSTAYTISSFEVFDTLAHLNGQMIAFTPHTTNGATVTLNVDSLGARPLRTAPGAELLSGTIIQGTPYVAVYNNSDGAFYLQGFYGNPYNVPLGAGMDYWGAAAPNSAFAIPVGQAISRTTYASLYALIGNTYGSGNGTTTFNLPNKSGRVSAAIDLTGTVLTGATITSGGATVLGGTGGGETQTLTLGQIPTGITAAQNNIPIFVNTNGTNVPQGEVTSSMPSTGGPQLIFVGGSNAPLTSTGTINVAATSNNTGGGAHPNVQPTIMCNYIMRVL
jgi:microcystin-dependent protein